jgi:hypothetical protein
LLRNHQNCLAIALVLASTYCESEAQNGLPKIPATGKPVEEPLSLPLEIDQASDPDLRLSEDNTEVGPEILFPERRRLESGLRLRFNPAISMRDGLLIEKSPTIHKTAVDLKSLQIEFSKSITDLSFYTDYDALNSQLNYFFVDWTGLDWTVRTGLAPTIESGSESLHLHSTELFPSVYLERNAPFGGQNALVEFRSKSNELGTVRFQMMQDVLNRDSAQRGYYSLERTQPALAFEWSADFGSLSPMIQFGTYDQNHSNYKSFMVLYRFARFHILYDYLLDARYLFDHSDGTASIDKISRLRMELFYRPWEATEFRASFIDFGVVQGGIDIFANPPLDSTPNYSDNFRSTGLSVTQVLNPQFSLYTAWHSQQARFLDTSTAELNDSDEYEFSQFEIGLFSKLDITTK